MEKQELFLRELEERLEQNRKIAQKSWIPKPLHRLVGYFGFHSFRVLVIASFVIAMVMFGFGYEAMVNLSKTLFVYL